MQQGNAPYVINFKSNSLAAVLGSTSVLLTLYFSQWVNGYKTKSKPINAIAAMPMGHTLYAVAGEGGRPVQDMRK